MGAAVGRLVLEDVITPRCISILVEHHWGPRAACRGCLPFSPGFPASQEATRPNQDKAALDQVMRRHPVLQTHLVQMQIKTTREAISHPERSLAGPGVCSDVGKVNDEPLRGTSKIKKEAAQCTSSATPVSRPKGTGRGREETFDLHVQSRMVHPGCKASGTGVCPQRKGGQTWSRVQGTYSSLEEEKF